MIRLDNNIAQRLGAPSVVRHPRGERIHEIEWARKRSGGDRAAYRLVIMRDSNAPASSEVLARDVMSMDQLTTSPYKTWSNWNYFDVLIQYHWATQCTYFVGVFSLAPGGMISWTFSK
jgi:hypothetical protein